MNGNHIERQRCVKHPAKEIEFLQVRGFQNQQNKSLFYCACCMMDMMDDNSFNKENYLQVDQLIDLGMQFLTKWPPVCDQQLLEQLKQSFNNKLNSSPLQQIQNYFSQLKKELIDRIDDCQNRLIYQSQQKEMSVNNQIMNRYAEITNINQLRQLIVDKTIPVTQKQDSYIVLIQQMQQQMAQTTQQLDVLYNDIIQSQQQLFINFDQFNNNIQSIFTSINQISLFGSQNNQNFNNQQGQFCYNNNNNKVNALMSLISNKSNFLKEEFLSQLKVLLDNSNQIFNQISFNNIFDNNLFPIDFSQLNNQEIQIVANFVNHQSQLKTNPQYLNDVKKSVQVRQVNAIMDNRMNFLTDRFKSQIDQYLISSYPFLQQVSFTNIFTDRPSYRNVKNVPNDMFADLVNLINLQKAISNNNYYFTQLTNQFKQLIKQNFNQIQQKDIDHVLNKFPILDLLLPQSIDILPNIQIVKTFYNKCQEHAEIIRNQTNNEIEMFMKYEYIWTNAICDTPLEKDKKYVFRVQLTKQDESDKFVYIGLMQDSIANSNLGCDDRLSCYLSWKANEPVKFHFNNGIGKLVNCNSFVLSQENILEMRVCLRDKVLEMYDYPHYHNKITVTDSDSSNLISLQALKLYFGLNYTNFKVILKNAFIVAEF